MKDYKELVEMHNSAIQDDLYGQRLYTKLLTLQLQSKIQAGDVDKLYMLSVNSPKVILD